MKFDAEFVEYIVREVIRRLKADAQFAAGGSPQPADTARELHLTDRVITLASLQGRLDGVTEVTTPRNAVITPAVRDELASRKIRVVRG